MYKVLHLESTDVCQAACPACARELDREFDKTKSHHLTIAHIQQHFSYSDLSRVEKMFMCGNYGDPAAAENAIDIYHYFRNANPSIVLGMNTNGGLRSPNWWILLSKILNQPRDYVVFSIDGLKDTNHLYRKNVQWHRVMENAQAFIDAGGSAHWDMLVYKHNEHQVDECESLARSMGFRWFRAKVSRRPLTQDLEYPITWDRLTYQPGRIDCHALKEKSAYIDAQGRLHPCCWLGSRQSDFVKDIQEVQITWQTDQPNLTCATVCTAQENITNFESQWRREVELC